MDSEIAQASRSSRLNIPVKLSRGSKKMGLTDISAMLRYGYGPTRPKGDNSKTDEESKNDEKDENDNEGEGTRPDKNEDRGTPAGRANNPTLLPEQSKPEPKSAKPSAPPLKVGKTRITISDNLSTDDNKKNRRLLALKPKSLKPASTSNLDISGEQNKKRLMMARQEREGEVFGGSENHGPITYDSNTLQANGLNSLDHGDQMKIGPPHMDNFGITSLPLPEGQFICSKSGSDSGDFNFDSYGYPNDLIMNSPYLNNMSPKNINISGIRPPSSYPEAAFNRMTPQQMSLIQQQQAAMARQQQNALQNQEQMAMNPLGIDAIAMGIPSESLNHAQAFREYLLQVTQAKEPNRYLILHRIKGKKEQIYFDPPEWVVGQSHTRILKSRLPLSNLTDYLDKHTDISFIVFRDYEESHTVTTKEMVAAAAADNSTGITKSPVHEEEKILTVSENLTGAIKSILKSKPEFVDLLAWFEKDETELPSPFVFIYHSRAVIQELIEDTSDLNAVRQLKLMMDYIYKNYGPEYDAADTMFDASYVPQPYIKYLFKPGDVLVKGTGSDVNGYMLVTWPLDSTSTTASLEGDGKNKPSSQYTMEVRSWSFDGAFNRAHGRDDLHGASEERYVIDMKTFRELRPEDEKKKKALHREDGKRKASDTLDEDTMAQDSPPYPSFVYLLPSKIIGYNMRHKKWVELHPDWLSEVVWDKKAFKKLVLAQKTKDLIEALIVNQIAAEESTDLISGKGNGLILLLHEGPGTGKTLTAESVAEIAEKPLYRVTFGDIGSEPEEVEQYLNSVLDLGKAWSCVVLLDEADVFLEERSMSDIKRNALVSIFLRALEYHDGIIILTSNRVGTFDEAFKSRIQLALHTIYH
ncbi:hypothetical protein BHYA_0124g00110 [Botrytis hyacinthi]|uniref:AAA+ ATPase domain-containing protein n=1 Tax=Botrytis hyacinthi TaxID=278943 RepID=A0A4Z1GLY8_9HELO|nr:hypothetical protein BHYA_0124g00110 [Botrytis hyacinthi]